MDTKIPQIAQDYIDYLNDAVSELDPDILLYGSTVYGKVSSDLDVSMIVKKFTQKDFKRIEELTKKFQIEHDMTLDDEVPYSSKLVYTEAEVEYMLRNSPFKKVNGIYRISPIEKTTEFLSSEEMKYRLLLNILTTRSLTLRGNSKRIDTYRQKAWDLLVRVILSYNELSEVDLDRFIGLLHKDEKSNQEGEMFLGYKTNIHQKMIDLQDDCERTFNRLLNEGKVIKVSKTRYKVSDAWQL